MMNPSQWAGLGVQDFFNGFNWKGDPPKLSPTMLTPEGKEKTSTEVNWLGLTLQDVLGRANWSGRTLASTSVVHPASVPFDPELSLKLSVLDFFKELPWKGQGVIPSVNPETPKKAKTPIQTIPEPSDDWTITDLSDLL